MTPAEYRETGILVPSLQETALDDWHSVPLYDVEIQPRFSPIPDKIQVRIEGKWFLTLSEKRIGFGCIGFRLMNLGLAFLRKNWHRFFWRLGSLASLEIFYRSIPADLLDPSAFCLIFLYFL